MNRKYSSEQDRSEEAKSTSFTVHSLRLGSNYDWLRRRSASEEDPDKVFCRV